MGPSEAHRHAPQAATPTRPSRCAVHRVKALRGCTCLTGVKFRVMLLLGQSPVVNASTQTRFLSCGRELQGIFHQER